MGGRHDINVLDENASSRQETVHKEPFRTKQFKSGQVRDFLEKFTTRKFVRLWQLQFIVAHTKVMPAIMRIIE